MSALAAGLAPFFKLTSVTLIRKDPLPELFLGEKSDFRIKRFTDAVTLAASPKPDPDKYRLDVTTRQSHEFQARFTRHPVVRGESITDHRFRRPQTFSFQGWITATPYIPWTSGTFGGSPIGDRLAEQRRSLEAMFERGEPVLMVSSGAALDNMGITSLSFNRDSETGAALQVSIRLVEVRIVQEVQAKPVPAGEAAKLGFGDVPSATSTAG